MTNEEKMLKLVLDDPELKKGYGYSPDDYEDLGTALRSTNPVVANVARIVKNLHGSTDKSDRKSLYYEVFNNLKDELDL